MPMVPTDGKSTLVQVMAWCRQATRHYLSQCWSRSLSPYGVIRPQWVLTVIVWKWTWLWQTQYIPWNMHNACGFNSLRPRQNGQHFAGDIFKCIFLNKNVWIPIEISLKLVPKGPINNIPALVKIMAWRRPGNKPLSEPMMVNLPTHICISQPQWVNMLCFVKPSAYQGEESLALS